MRSNAATASAIDAAIAGPVRKNSHRGFFWQYELGFGQTSIRVEMLEVCLARFAVIEMTFDFLLSDVGQIAESILL